jgi:hypothetical protein
LSGKSKATTLRSKTTSKPSSFDKATTVALTALRKFSPEAIPFTIRKLEAALANADKLITALGAVEVRPDEQREHINGKEAA